MSRSSVCVCVLATSHNATLYDTTTTTMPLELTASVPSTIIVHTATFTTKLPTLRYFAFLPALGEMDSKPFTCRQKWRKTTNFKARNAFIYICMLCVEYMKCEVIQESIKFTDSILRLEKDPHTHTHGMHKKYEEPFPFRETDIIVSKEKLNLEEIQRKIGLYLDFIFLTLHLMVRPTFLRDIVV